MYNDIGGGGGGRDNSFHFVFSDVKFHNKKSELLVLIGNSPADW